MNYIASIILVVVVMVLFYGLLALLRGQRSKQLVRSLTLRIGFSIFLMVVLLVGWKLGVFVPSNSLIKSLTFTTLPFWLV